MSFGQSVHVAGKQQAALETATADGCKIAQSYLNQAVELVVLSCNAHALSLLRFLHLIPA